MAEKLWDTERLYRDFFELNRSPIAVIDASGRYLDANQAFLDFVEEPKESLLQKTVFSFAPPRKKASQEKVHRRAWQKCATLETEYYIHGRTKVLELTVTPIIYKGIEAVVGTGIDITERKKAEQALRISDQRLKFALDSVNGAVWDWEVENGSIYFSSRWYAMLGYEPNELPQKWESWRKLIHPLDLSHVEKTTYQHLQTGKPFEIEFRMRTKDCKWKWILGRGKTGERDENGKPSRMIGIHVDISERKLAESEREIIIKLLEALKKENDLRELIRDITILMQNWSECEAVAIRLQDNIDYPYFETKGFPPRFVEAERYLCATDINGDLIRDSTGNPVLECMCGNVIQGRFDPKLPFFTEFGSFWTNSTTDLLAATSESDRQARTRNRCNSEGYESVALIPLKEGNKRLGLLQFKSSRSGQFDEQKIYLFERLASSLAIGLSQRKTALALRESEEKYRTVFEQAAVGISRISFHDARWIEVNAAFARMVGYTHEELQRTSWSQITHPDDLELDLIPFRKMAAGELESYTVEKRFIHKKGHHVWAILTMSLVRNSKGIPDYEIAIFEDITKRKKAEEDLQRRTEELAAVNHELEAFSYSVSHDLRAPLRSIIGFSSLLRNHAGQLDGKANEYLQRITAGAEKMNVLVDDMLRLSRISRQEAVIQEIDLSSMAKAIVRELERQHPERHVEIHIAGDLKARGDAQLINMVLTNLLDNAWKYTGKTAEAYIEFGSCRKNGKKVFFIRDNGAGFPMEQANRLFMPFQRLHSESEFSGTGIGLPIVKRVINLHGGEIWTEGEMGKGAIFYFTLGQ